MSHQQIKRPPKPRRRLGQALLAMAVIGWIVFALSAEDEAPEQPVRRDPPRPFTVGRGARSALVLPARGDRSRPAVIFLHGWGLTGEKAYRPWLDHLAAGGSPVILPRYQTSIRTRSSRVTANMIAGVRAALARLRPRPRNVVVVGHSAGGVLAVSYAARARRLRLPPAIAVMSVYPGSALRDMPSIPEDDPAELPAATRRLVVMTSPRDELVGTALGERIYGGAVNIRDRRRRLVTVDDPVAGDHFAPVVNTPAARRVFWSQLDRVLEVLR